MEGGLIIEMVSLLSKKKRRKHEPEVKDNGDPS